MHFVCLDYQKIVESEVRQRLTEMLKIYYGDLDTGNYIYNPDVFFNNTYDDSWITDPVSKEMIRDVDKSEVIGPRLIDSPFLGAIGAERLSGGVKTLILMDHDDEHIFNASFCGDNCAKWILKIGESKDLTIRLGYLMNFGAREFNIEIVNLNKIVHNMKELNESVLDFKLI